MSKGKNGLKACSNIPVRNFRLFVAVTMPGGSPGLPAVEEFTDTGKTATLLDIKRQMTETLKAALLYPRHLQPEDLLEWTRRLFNHYPDAFYLSLAKQATPVIEVGASKKITVIISEGKELEIREIEGERLISRPIMDSNVYR